MKPYYLTILPEDFSDAASVCRKYLANIKYNSVDKNIIRENTSKTLLNTIDTCFKAIETYIKNGEFEYDIHSLSKILLASKDYIKIKDKDKINNYILSKFESIESTSNKFINIKEDFDQCCW